MKTKTWTTSVETNKGTAALSLSWNSARQAFLAVITCTTLQAPIYHVIHAAFDPSMENTARKIARAKFAEVVNANI